MLSWRLVDVVSTVNDVLFRNAQNTYFVYPVVLIFGTALALTIPRDLFNNLKTLYLLKDTNKWNRLFANKGDFVFTGLFLLILVARLLEFTMANKYQSVQDSIDQARTGEGSTESFKRNVVLTIRGSILRFLSIQTVLLLLLAFRAFIVRLTSTDLDNLTGFRISGHFIFLTTAGLSTMLEFRHSLSDTQLFTNLRMEPFSYKLRAIFYLFTSTMIATILVLIIWLIFLFVTAVFYHTFPEKFIGLIFGLIPSTVTYFGLVPRLTAIA